MHNVEEKTKKICEMKDRLFDILNTEMAKGYQEIDAKEAGEVVDMIKDLAEVEKFCWEAHYYKTVTEAMEESEREPRYGEKRSYLAMQPNMNKERIDYDEATRYGYSMNQTGNMRNMSYGYSGQNSQGGNSGRSSRYGYAYDRFDEARRYYTQTHAEHDKYEMETAAQDHLKNVTQSIRDIWADADPELRMKIKHSMTELLGEMN